MIGVLAHDTDTHWPVKSIKINTKSETLIVLFCKLIQDVFQAERVYRKFTFHD